MLNSIYARKTERRLPVFIIDISVRVGELDSVQSQSKCSMLNVNLPGSVALKCALWVSGKCSGFAPHGHL